MTGSCVRSDFTVSSGRPLPLVQDRGHIMRSSHAYTNAVPVIRTHGPLAGVVCRQDLVDLQNRRLDEFHLQDQV